MKFFRFIEARREYLSGYCAALSAGSYIGGVMFNILGAGENLEFAAYGFGLMLVFLTIGLILKGGK